MWSSWAAKRGRKCDYKEVVHTLGIIPAKNLSKGQYEHGKGTGWWKGMRKPKERQSSGVLLITKEEKSILSIISIPEMWKDSHRELKMEKYHEHKPDLCREMFGRTRDLHVVLLLLPCCALQSQNSEISRGKGKKKDKCQCLTFADVGWESRGLGKPSLLSWLQSL